MNDFERIDDVSIVYSPDSHAVNGLTRALIDHCESQRDRFTIIDAPKGISNVMDLQPRKQYGTKHAAYYYPWITIIDHMIG